MVRSEVIGVGLATDELAKRVGVASRVGISGGSGGEGIGRNTLTRRRNRGGWYLIGRSWLRRVLQVEISVDALRKGFRFAGRGGCVFRRFGAGGQS